MLIGYARVSTGEQTTAAQVAALKTSGCELIFRDNASGGRWDRPELHKLLSQLRKGDVLVVWTLDRLSRSLRDVLTIMERVQERHAGFRSLKEAVDTTTPAGRMMMQMVGAFAEVRARDAQGTDQGGPRRRAQGRPDRRPAAEAQAPPATGNCDARQAGEEDRRRRGAPVRRPPGNGVAATPADLDRVFYRTFGSIAPQAPIPATLTSSIQKRAKSPTAQRRPGRESRRHADDVRLRTVSGLAQRRPGRESRRHATTLTPKRITTNAQRRPGRESRRHMAGTRQEVEGIKAAQRRPGRESRRHPSGSSAAAPVAALNEGRDVNPGDTLAEMQGWLVYHTAQRRPGRESRRHSDARRAKATPFRRAQRRPGRESRRHRASFGLLPALLATLNEGRDVNPGDTTLMRLVHGHKRIRSTKAGT